MTGVVRLPIRPYGEDKCHRNGKADLVDELTKHTERDLARIAVAQQAARLADSLHKLVCKYGHDVPPGTWIGSLIPPVLQGVEHLQSLAVVDN